MEVITSNEGGRKLCYDGYMYTKKSESNSSIFWVCTNRRSGCRGSARTDSGITDIIVNNAHDHLPNEVNIDLAKVRAAMKESARDSNEKTSLIYTRALQNVDDNTMAVLPSADICKRSIRSQRNPEFPKVPDSIKDIVVEGEWTQTSNGERFLLCDNGQDSVSRILVFGTDVHLRLLSQSDKWLMDGNHAMCPTQFRQMFVIQVPLGTASIPVVYALMQDNGQSSYEEMFQAVVDKCEELGYSLDPLTVIVDFEIGLRQALRNVIGEDLRIQGCFYHLTQATWRKVQELGLSELYKTDENFRHICGMLDGLAFLPVADVEAGMGVVRNQAMPAAAYFV